MILPSLWEMGIVMMNQISSNAILMVVTAVQGHDLEATVTTACVMKPSIKQVQYIQQQLQQRQQQQQTQQQQRLIMRVRI